VIGITPGDWYSQALYQPTGVQDRLWQGMRAGEIGLSEIAASRLGVVTGETVELPTVEGPKRYRVSGIFHPRIVNDTTVGDIVLFSAGSGLTYLQSLGSPVYCGIKIDWDVLGPPPLRTGVAAMTVLVLAGAVGSP
jgi:hypothetical protein